MVRFYSGCTGLKTGFTSGAGYCLSASAQRDGMELIAVVMGAATSQDRFAACKSMLDYGFANFALFTPAQQENATVAVELGKQSRVNVKPAEEAALLVDKGQLSSVCTEMTLEEKVTAPVMQGQQLGTLTVKAGDKILAQVALVAEQPVERMNWGDIFMMLLRRVAMAKPAE